MSAAEHTFGSGAANEFDKYTATKSNISVGLARGHRLSKRKPVRKAPKKGKVGAKARKIKDICREVTGLAPYEKRILDVLKLGAGNVEKRMYKMSKKRLGTHRRAGKKRDEIKDYYAKVRAAAHAAK